MNARQNFFFALAPVLCAVVFLIPFSSHAATGLTIQPVKITETLKPGESVQGEILLTNASDGDVNVEVSKQDFVPVAGAETIQFVGSAPGVTSVKDWITIGDTKNFLFKKGESKQIPYTITAPLTAEPGGHFGVVFFKATQPNNAGELRIGTQVGMLVLVAIPGNHLEKGNILSFSTDSFVQGGPVMFQTKFQNTGTVYFEPRGSIRISNMFGQSVATVPVEGQVVLPTSVKTLNTAWNVSGFLVGRYIADLTIVDGDGNTLTADTVQFWAFPVWYVLGFIATLLILFFFFKYLRRRVKISVALK